MTEPTDELRAVVSTAYEAFNRRDIGAAVAAMTEDVEWANGWEGGQVHGREGVRDYWTRQWAELDPHVSPVAMTVDDDGRVLVDVDQEVRDHAGTVLAEGRVRHAYSFRDLLVARFDILEPETP